MLGTTSPLLAILPPRYRSPPEGLVKQQIVGVPEFPTQCVWCEETESFHFHTFLGDADACPGVTLRITRDNLQMSCMQEQSCQRKAVGAASKEEAVLTKVAHSALCKTFS